MVLYSHAFFSSHPITIRVSGFSYGFAKSPN